MDYLILVSRFEPLSEEFENSIRLRRVKGKLFEVQTAGALERLLKGAENDSCELEVISGYRSADYQQMLWEKEISKEIAGGLNYDKAKEKVALTLALPGESEHQTGLAVDFGVRGDDDVSYNFIKSRQSVWLERNAHKFGFILRYPRLKDHITGIAFEPWHYRYVGVESACIIKQNGICLEEFLDFYQDKYLDSTNKGI
jgi:D-alanyl-D-alanine carboxypeptidase